MKSLYLNGSGAHATTPAVDFNALHSFTLASWVKLQHPPAHPSTIYGYWGPPHFLFDAGQMKSFVSKFQITKEDSNHLLRKGEIKVKNDHRSKFSNLSNWKEEA